MIFVPFVQIKNTRVCIMDSADTLVAQLKNSTVEQRQNITDDIIEKCMKEGKKIRKINKQNSKKNE